MVAGCKFQDNPGCAHNYLCQAIEIYALDYDNRG